MQHLLLILIMMDGKILIVTGEWMPVKIFINNKGKFTETDIANQQVFGKHFILTM